MNNQENLGKNIAEIFQDKYVIPLYQRNYAWREEEIVQLLQDIFETFVNKKAHYYIGSLVVLKRHNGIFEVIDGQQRLTTLSLIVRLLERSQRPVLSYDSRPSVEEFFELFYKNPDNADQLNSPEVYYLKTAVHIIKETTISNGKEALALSNKEFADFLMNNVYLVRVEIPEDTDVASYFEIMNNRGEQLQKHEIVKALMMAKLKPGQQKLFAKIWDACSQMNVPIQKMFSDVEERKSFFGENYDSFNKKGFCSNPGENVKQTEKLVIDQILHWQQTEKVENNLPVEDANEYQAIIDWPNFLMHILKLYNKNIPLNEKYLLESYNSLDSNEEFVWGFIQTLLYCRTVFDRFVVKTEHNPEKEEEFTWCLLKPVKREYKNNHNQLDYVSSFSDNGAQDILLKALSMLQVTYRTRVYKNWLFELLNWFYNEGNKKDLSQVKADELLSFLNMYLWERYEELKLTMNPRDDEHNWGDTYCAGTRTPHFLFNFIDYLYWLKKENPEYEGFKFKDFEFKYWSSVEHHLAQNKAGSSQGADQYINNLGNLCLISQSSNSRLSDRLVQEKIEFYGSGNIGPNRQRIYAKSKCEDNKYQWREKQIREHYNEIVNLLKEAPKLLGVSSNPVD